MFIHYFCYCSYEVRSVYNGNFLYDFLLTLLAEAKGPFLCYYVLPNNVLHKYPPLAFTGYANVERFEPSTDTYLVSQEINMA